MANPIAYLSRKISVGRKIIATYRNWPEIFADYAGLYRKKEMIVTVRDGTRYLIRSHRVTKTDFYVLNESWLYKLHAGMAQRFIHPGATVIDIGAHIGAFTVYAARQAADVTVYSFEPDKDNFKALSENIKLNHLGGRVFPFNMAMAGKPGELTLWKSVTDTGQHTAFADRLTYENADHVSHTVPATTLKQFFDERKIASIDLMKIDCEGMEYDILYNLPPEYLKRIKAFSIEHHWAPGGDYKELAAYLAGRGFAITYPDPEFALIYAWRSDAESAVSQ